MLIVVILLYIFLIFPLFLKVDIQYVQEYKRVFFKIKIFLFITVLNGYVERFGEDLSVRLTFPIKKIIIIALNKITTYRKRIKPLQDYHVLSSQTILEIGNKDNILSVFSVAFFLEYVYSFLEKYVYTNKPYVKLNNRVFIYQNENKFNLYVTLNVVFNILKVMISIIKILVEKMVYAIRKRKQPNKQSS